MNKTKAAAYITLYINFIVYSLASVCAKYAAISEDKLMSVVFIGGEIALLGIYAIIWQQVLKKIPLGVAMSSKGITIIYGLVFAVILFGEQITVTNIVGALIVVAGICLVAQDD
ncbi:MAG: EamA family transporter [Eubacterium sp.]|nr:EamA family transporter [Eubacterium sp.]